MLSPDYLFNCSDRIVEIYEDLQSFAVNDIARRIVKTGEITSTAEFQIWQAQQAGLHLNAIQAFVVKVTGLSQNEVKRLFEEAGTKSLDYDNRIYKSAGLSPLPISQSPQMLAVLQSVYEQTNGELVNFTRSIAKTSQQMFFSASDKAYMEISSGMSDYISAISRAVRETAQSGIQVVNYDSGAKISVEAGVRRAVLTGVNQGAAKLTMAQADYMDCDLVEVTSHANARPEHMLWQGKIFSRSGTSDKYPDFISSTRYGTGPGLCGWNCRHSFYPFFEGVSVPGATQYNSEEVKKKYDLSQQQRGFERRIRNTKRELNATDAASRAATGDLKDGLKSQYDTQAAKLKRQRDEYKTFCHEHNLYTENERTQIPGFGRSEAARASIQTRKSLEFSANNGIIDTKDKFGKIDPPVRYPTSQEEIDSIKSNDLRNVKFSAPVTYNSRLRASYGQTKTVIQNGRIKEQAIEIGKQRKPGKTELIDTLIHEELEARIVRRAYTRHVPKYIAMDKLGERGTHPYVLPRVERFLRLKGLK